MACLSVEKRSRTRHKVGAEVRFHWCQDGVEHLGWGRIRDLSNRAVCFEAGFSAPAGTLLEVCIPWPEPLQSVCDLELVARGSVTRSESENSVLKIEDYELRTCGTRSFHQAAICGSNCNVVG